MLKKFIYDGQHIAMAFDGDDTLTHRSMYGPGIDMILADEAFDGATGNFLDLYWMLGDHQGSVTSVLSHNSGQTSLVQQLAYTAFGAIGSIKDGQGNNVTGLSSRFGYTGREFDPETGDYYYRARYYDPQTGRFLSQDPIGFAAGDMNLYRYVGNSSPNMIDPSGLRAGQHTTTAQPLGRTGPVGPVRYNDGVGPQGTLPLGSGQRPPQHLPILETRGTTPGSQGDPWWWPSDMTYIWNYVTTDPLGALGSAGTGAGEGAAAAIDGAIPFWDPFADWYDQCDETLRNSKWLGGAARNLLLLAGGVGIWNAAGLPTFGFGLGTMSGGGRHVVYSISGNWFHATGAPGLMWHTSLVPRQVAVIMGGYWRLEGIPILFPSAAASLAQSGQPASSCLSGSLHAFRKGLFYW